jgi:predicted nuclease of predicted toxin-antitoxin system
MRILLDENLPHKLRLLLAGHEVRTVAYQGWAGLTNGALLRAAEDAAFDAILTADQGIRYQQNRKHRQVALIVLSDNDESVIIANVKAILAAIDAIQPGALLWVDLGISHEG